MIQIWKGACRSWVHSFRVILQQTVMSVGDDGSMVPRGGVLVWDITHAIGLSKKHSCHSLHEHSSHAAHALVPECATDTSQMIMHGACVDFFTGAMNTCALEQCQGQRLKDPGLYSTQHTSNCHLMRVPFKTIQATCAARWLVRLQCNPQLSRENALQKSFCQRLQALLQPSSTKCTHHSAC